jgi:hypothetical protein
MLLPVAVLLAVIAASASPLAQEAPNPVAAPKASAEGTSAPPADPFKNAGRPESSAGGLQQPGGAGSIQVLAPELRPTAESVSRVTLTAQQYGNLASMRHTTGAVHDLGDRMAVTNSRINKALAAADPALRTTEQMPPAERAQFDALARHSNENDFATGIAQWVAERYPQAIEGLERLSRASDLGGVVANAIPELKAQLADAQRILQAASASHSGQPTGTGSLGARSSSPNSD